MCTLAIYFRAFEGYPLVLAANRDEFLERPTSPPRLLDRATAALGGQDEVCGGTWFGVNAHGVAAALLNRRSTTPNDPTKRSRGLLCLDALRATSAASAEAQLRREQPLDYNPFNLLVADPTRATVVTNHDRRFRFFDLSPGLHLLTNLDLDDPECPRIGASTRLFGDVIDARLDPSDPVFIERLHAILSRHDTELDARAPGLGNGLCVHAGEYGTRSSTIAMLDHDDRWRYLHCNTAPCGGSYREVELPRAAAGAAASSGTRR
jgi:uncharacterized protein with NRDE domain